MIFFSVKLFLDFSSTFFSAGQASWRGRHVRRWGGLVRADGVRGDRGGIIGGGVGGAYMLCVSNS